MKIFGEPEVDLFASRINYQLDSYVAWKPDPHAMHIDAFSLSWKHDFNYIFPPFSLMARILQKLDLEEGTALVIAPMWPSQTWFSQALQMLIAPPVLLPKDCLWLPQRPGHRHPLHQKLTLMAMKLSGKPSLTKGFRQRLPSFSSSHGELGQETNIGVTTNSGCRFVSGNRLIHLRHLWHMC